LQLGSGEGVQFVAARDSEGQMLQRNCNYALTGSMPAASFWTLRAAAPDGRGITPQGAPLNLHSGRILRDSEGGAALYVGPNLASRNWLEIDGDGAFDLILTFYDASVFAGFGNSIDTLPVVTSEGCK
jgi:hypothetical protein